ncbi:polysaccharide biosynthesis protein [Prochlorococcus marinus]|nr:nucleoside-diphosphate sugar epimerase/dehydratase [Prochlorococcus marinus]
MNEDFNFKWILYIGTIFGTFFYIITGQYKALTRYSSSVDFYAILARNIILVFILFLIGKIFNLAMPALTIWILTAALVSSFSFIVRLFLKDVIFFLKNKLNNKQKNIVIYGAGDAGNQLANALCLSQKYKIISFIDDSSNLQGRTIGGIPIKSPNYLNFQNSKVDKVLLAIPSLTKERKKTLLENLEKKSIGVLQIPSIDELTSGSAQIDTLRPVSPEDLLSRDIATYEDNNLEELIKNKVVCISGAGGSIGSELCRQIIKLKPKKLILIEMNEHSLYKINYELTQKEIYEIEIIPILENASNYKSLNLLFKQIKINILFHAAAYKHVPLVEMNPMSGLANNFLSTSNLCKLALENSIERIILISSDKAVRPTNLMGVSKRLSELIFQAYSKIDNKKDVNKKTIFAMVRFGNVLGSSGSVVPLFNKQITKGGPITLTHPDVIRFFMTISESVQLVLQAALLANGGDLFILDMGKPVKIYDLAMKMINLRGLKIKNKENPDGDIEIIFTGLRPGEKLFEELLIDADTESTINPYILRAQEKFIMPENLFPRLEKLEYLIDSRDSKEVWNLLNEIVPEWIRSKELN